MSGSLVPVRGLPMDAITTYAILPAAPITEWGILRNNEPSSTSIILDLEECQVKPTGSSGVVDLTANDEALPSLSTLNAHLHSPSKVQTTDLAPDSDILSGDLHISSVSSPTGTKVLLEQANPADHIAIPEILEDAPNPKRSPQAVKESSLFSSLDLTIDSSDEESLSGDSPTTSPDQFDAVHLKKQTGILIPKPINLAKRKRDEADEYGPMPRILRKFGSNSAPTLFEEESDPGNAQSDSTAPDELNIWLESQLQKDSDLEIFGVTTASSRRGRYKPPPRNSPIEHPFCTIASYSHNHTILRPGVSVELRDHSSSGDFGQGRRKHESQSYFMRIVEIIQDTRDQAVTLRGWTFQRAAYLGGELEKKSNELCWIMHLDEDDTRDMKIQSMETVPVTKLIRRRKIRLTNQPWPKISFMEDVGAYKDSLETIRDERVLVCRYMFICYYMCNERREMNRWSERVLRRLRRTDCDKGTDAQGDPGTLPDNELRRVWRGETDAIDLTEETAEREPSDYIQSSTSQDQASPFTITGITSRIDWVTADGIKGYTMTGSDPPSKRSADADTSSGQPKQHRMHEFSVQATPLPRTTSMIEQFKQKSSSIPPSKPTRTGAAKVEVSNVKRDASAAKTKRKYTFGDSFCGAGGMSRAAHQAGLQIKYAFDFNDNACTSYEMNFPTAGLQCLSASDFVQLETDTKVDIAHFSPPCQFFSSAHTIKGKDDEMNTASLFAVGELLTKSRPRVVTLEQTSSFVDRTEHQGYLNALIQMFTCRGFSIRWRLLQCADYGLPQKRLRTFMIASWLVNKSPPLPQALLTLHLYLPSPGEPLPPFPQPTHSEDPSTTGLLPWKTINAAIQSISPSATDNDTSTCIPRSEPPYSGERLANTLTCTVGGLVHPSGERDFTVRELAALQGFPDEHVFGLMGAKRQIGNAVPPIVGRKVLESVVEALEREDGVGLGD
ncbi:MAG: hypothetical protein Q9219_003718 [cf. Caloplaca sp. 3 TL-2023]